MGLWQISIFLKLRTLYPFALPNIFQPQPSHIYNDTFHFLWTFVKLPSHIPCEPIFVDDQATYLLYLNYYNCFHTDCVDKDNYCTHRVLSGQCWQQEFRAWMHSNCKKSCCSSNKNAYCLNWANAGHCESNPDYMHQNCASACAVRCSCY